jgi:GR25 family glycosyltransferase involved in LPS biosynthesis
MEEQRKMTEKYFKNVLFINLEERQDRLLNINKEFAKMGIQNAERILAVKLENGALGCTLSHIKCLELAKKQNYEMVVICEDDVEFTQPEIFWESLTKLDSSESSNWDVLLLAGNNLKPYNKIFDFALQVFNCQTTTAYIVKNHYYDKLLNNFRESSNRLIREPQMKHLYALDIYWKKLQIQDTWILPIPLTITQYNNWSNIENRQVLYRECLLDYEKKYLEKQSLPPKLFSVMKYNPS